MTYIVEDLWRDLRFAVRALAKQPRFAIIVVVVAAVGIGVNTAVFSIIDAVLLKPLNCPNPQELVSLVNTNPQGVDPGASVPMFSLWRGQTDIFQQVAAYDLSGTGLNITGGDRPQQVQAIHVSADYFSMLGARVVAGRFFTLAEDSANGGHVTVLSYGLWKNHYDANPNIVGSTIQLDGESYLVVGVIGPGFITETPADLWMPFQFDLNSHDVAAFFGVIARLRPDVTVAQANAQFGLVADQFRRIYGEGLFPSENGFGVVSLSQFMIGNSRSRILVLWGAVTFVLLIACANLASLLLARAAARQREFASRVIFGAGRARLIRQLLVESLTLSLTGGGIGLGLGFAAVRVLLRINPGDIPRIGEEGTMVTLDLHVMLFTLGISLLTGIAFGIVPAIDASRPNLAVALNESGRHASFGARSGRLRSALIVGQMALTVVLVICAALLVQTFVKLESVDPGFATHNVVSMSMSVSGARFQKTAPVAQVIREGTDRLLAVPGVTDTGVSNCLPMVRGYFGMVFDVVGRPGGNVHTGDVGFCSISSGYFTTLRIPLLHGRYFTKQDDATALQVAIINSAMARQYWSGSDPLKDRILIGAGVGPAFAEGPRQVIGIVADTHDDGPDTDPIPMMYIPLAQMPDLETALNSRVAPLWWFVHSVVDPRTLITPISTALREGSGGLPVGHFRTMHEIQALSIARQRFNMVLLTAFGCAGLLMAAIGVYGVLSYSVQQRTKELGIRMALGAQASDIRSMVIRQGMMLTLIGVLIGSVGAFWVTHLLTSFLFGVRPLDPLSFIGTPVLLIAVALFSIWAPAVRATRVDSMTALRIE